jgi:FYVE/RhoGEF/PH domain-containing protein 1
MSHVTSCEQLLVSRTREEKTVWLDALCMAIDELYKRRSSFKVGKESSIPEEIQKPPQYIKVDGVQRCMDCRAGFGVMKRKHHCRACGMVSERNEMYYKQQ